MFGFRGQELQCSEGQLTSNGTALHVVGVALALHILLLGLVRVRSIDMVRATLGATVERGLRDAVAAVDAGGADSAGRGSWGPFRGGNGGGEADAKHGKAE